MVQKLCTTKAIDLFAGAGGFSLGFSLAGIDVVAAVEYHKPATKTYAHNFPEHLVYHKDINQLGPQVVERDLKQRDVSKDDIDLVIGGPPCPGFSNIGRSKIISLIRDGVWDGDETRHRFVQDPRNTCSCDLWITSSISNLVALSWKTSRE